MIIPIRCWTCSRIIGNRWELFNELQTKGFTAEGALDSLGLEEVCCRRMLLCHIDLVDRLVK